MVYIISPFLKSSCTSRVSTCGIIRHAQRICTYIIIATTRLFESNLDNSNRSAMVICCSMLVLVGKKIGLRRSKDIYIRGADTGGQSIHRIKVSGQSNDSGIRIPIS